MHSQPQTETAPAGETLERTKQNRNNNYVNKQDTYFLQSKFLD